MQQQIPNRELLLHFLFSAKQMISVSLYFLFSFWRERVSYKEINLEANRLL
ncbi:hypothetical protein FHS15_005264 [Paenibacillus castaneae]|nr:hypothetical protein [Paenibacillus castaneae]NIK80080.1 hypothetical protein [Paenibacillus castaneae]